MTSVSLTGELFSTCAKCGNVGNLEAAAMVRKGLVEKKYSSRTKPGEEQSAVVGGGFLLSVMICPSCVGGRVNRRLACSKNKYTPRSGSLLCGCQSSDLPLSTNGKSGLRTAAIADGSELAGERWREPKTVQARDWLGPQILAVQTQG